MVGRFVVVVVRQLIFSYPKGDPNIVGRDGSVPIIICLVPLINKDQLHHFTHTKKVGSRRYMIPYIESLQIDLFVGVFPQLHTHSTSTRCESKLLVPVQSYTTSRFNIHCQRKFYSAL